MATGMDQLECKRLLEAHLGITAYVAPTTPMKLALATSAHTDAAAGTEVSGGTYSRQNVTGNMAASATADANGAIISNTGVISFTGMPATTTTCAAEYDSAGTPRRGFWGDLAASKTTAAGDTLSFAAGALSFRIG